MKVAIVYDSENPMKIGIIDIDTGEPIDGVMDVKIHITPKGVPTTTLVLRKFRINIVTKVVRKFKTFWGVRS